MQMRPEARDSIKPFRLVKYFSLTSLVVILVPTILLSVFISQRAKNELLRKSEQYALLAAINLNHQVFTQFVLPTVLKFGRVKLSNPTQYERLDKVIRSTIHGFKIEEAIENIDIGGPSMLRSARARSFSARPQRRIRRSRWDSLASAA